MPFLLRPAASKTAAAFKRAVSSHHRHSADTSPGVSSSNSMIGTASGDFSASANSASGPASVAAPAPSLPTAQAPVPPVQSVPATPPQPVPAVSVSTAGATAPSNLAHAAEAIAAHSAAPLLQALASATGTAALSLATSATAASSVALLGQLGAKLAHTTTGSAPLASSTGAGADPADDPGDYHWAVGVVLAALAAVVSNVGLNFQKLTHIKVQDQSEKAKQNYWRSKLWLAGLVMIILGSVMDFAALAFGAQSIIAPLGSLTLVSNVFFAPCLLGETLTLRDVLATITIVLGASIAVAFASHKDTIYSLEELFGFYQQPRFGLYAIGVLVAIGVLWSAIQYMETIRKEAPRSPQYARLVKYHRFCYAALSGTIGAQSVLFAKCTAELVVNTVMGQGFLLSYYQTWMVIICMCTTIFLQLKWLNQGLQRFDALYIVPVFQSFWILVSVIAGLIFFGEGGEMTELQTIMFPIGVSLTVVGVYFLSQRGVDEDISARPHGHARRDSVPKAPAAAAKDKQDREPAEVKEEEPAHHQHDVESATEPLIGNQATSLAGNPAARPIRDPRKHRAIHQRIDSSVGFGGTGSPAAMLPTRAMVLGASLRPEDIDEPAAEVDDDDI